MKIIKKSYLPLALALAALSAQASAVPLSGAAGAAHTEYVWTVSQDAALKDAYANINHGRAYDAIPVLEAFLEGNPASAEAWYMLGTAYAAIDQQDAKASAFEKAVQIKASLRPLTGNAVQRLLAPQTPTPIRADAPAAVRPERAAASEPNFSSADNARTSPATAATMTADRPILTCPVQQPRVAKTAKPNIEVIKQLIRCRRGEEPARPGMDGATTVDITSIIPGGTRPWSLVADRYPGDAGTKVYLFKTDLVQRAHYRTRTMGTRFQETWGCQVDPFGEWQCGISTDVTTTQLPIITH